MFQYTSTAQGLAHRVITHRMRIGYCRFVARTSVSLTGVGGGAHDNTICGERNRHGPGATELQTTTKEAAEPEAAKDAARACVRFVCVFS